MPGTESAVSPVDVGTAVAAWQSAHPQASFSELAAAVEAQLDTLRAAVLSEALARCEPDGTAGEAPRPTCPTWGGPLQARGRQARTLTLSGNQTVTLTRRYAWCPTCAVGLFPPG